MCNVSRQDMEHYAKLFDDEGMTAMDAAQKMGLDRKNTMYVLDKMVRWGFIHMEQQKMENAGEPVTRLYYRGGKLRWGPTMIMYWISWATEL